MRTSRECLFPTAAERTALPSPDVTGRGVCLRGLERPPQSAGGPTAAGLRWLCSFAALHSLVVFEPRTSQVWPQPTVMLFTVKCPSVSTLPFRAFQSFISFGNICSSHNRKSFALLVQFILYSLGFLYLKWDCFLLGLSVGHRHRTDCYMWVSYW